jgi:hypothetical protein
MARVHIYVYVRAHVYVHVQVHVRAHNLQLQKYYFNINIIINYNIIRGIDRIHSAGTTQIALALANYKLVSILLY